MRDMSNISWLTDLYLLSQGAPGPQHRQRAIDAILEHIVQGFGGLTGCLAVQQRGAADGLTIVSVMALPAAVVGRHVAPGEGILGQVRQTARAVLINGDAREDARFDLSGDATAALRRRPRSALCWPLVVKGQVIGVLSINRSDALDPFTTEDLERGASAVALLALVVDNWQMHTDLQERVDGLSAMNAELQAVNHRLADAQHQLLQAEKMASIGQLAAGVAHEINNPIGYVWSNLQTLSAYSCELLGLVDRLVARPNLALEIAASGVDVEFLRQDMAALIRESRQGLDRVQQIVRNLKDFSRVDQTEDWQGADLVACLNSTLNIVNSEVKYKAVVDKDLAVLPEVQCLASQVNQVFLNLLVNAAQAVERDGRITLRCGHDAAAGAAGEVWFDIADNGCGIPTANLARVFEPFFTTKPVGQGTGLGLSLSYSTVRKHHGRLEVASEPGRGTRFRVVLHVRQTAAVSA